MIDEELKQSEKYRLNEDNEKKIVLLSTDNVARVETMIFYDSNYSISFRNDNKKRKTSIYWLDKMKQILFNKEADKDFKECLENIIICIDVENSTHINSDKKGRKIIFDRIYRYKDKLVDILKHGKLDLIEEISKVTKKSKGGRVNLSFASKFCHYMAYHIFDNEKYKDNYSIYDNIVKSCLPYYAEYFNIDINNYSKYDQNPRVVGALNVYNDYCKLIDKIIEENRKKTGEKISRNGFDHLLWYYYKGRV